MVTFTENSDTGAKPKPMDRSMSIRLPDELYARLRAAAKSRGGAFNLSASELARHIIVQYLDGEE